MSKRYLFRLRELVEQINRVALMQIVENELKGLQDGVISNTNTMHQIAELSLEARDLIKLELEYEPN